jgi:hypothetical protein
MTAEVAVMNAQGVALAADSAVTLDSSLKSSVGGRAFSTADKIFGITPRDPIAAMVHGSASFMGIPWETILKTYRRSLGTRSLATVADYAADFATFLEGNTALFPADVRARHVRKEVRSRFLKIRDQMEFTLKQVLLHRTSVNREWVERALAEEVNFFFQLYKTASPVRDMTSDDARQLIADHSNSIIEIQDQVLQGLPISPACRSQLEQLRLWFLTRFPLPHVCHVGHTSGVVFAGFGASEHFPSIVEMQLDSIADKRLRHLMGQHYSITTANPAAVLAFGQSDMVRTFMEGIDPAVTDNHTRELRQFWRGCTEIMLSEVDPQGKVDTNRIRRIAVDALERQLAGLAQWREREHVEQSLYLIQSLPKDELATVAESLVSLTSLKRRVSMDYSVGGPIDVCVISKHDGCVWVKKKQYFSADLNPGFFTRKHIAWEELSNAAKGKGNDREDEATPAESVSLGGSDPRSLLPEPDRGPGVAGGPSTSRPYHAGVGNPSLDERGDSEET